MKQNSKDFYNLSAILTSFSAVLLHSYLTYEHYLLKFGAAEQNSICNINQIFNCDAVNSSSFSEFLGAPIALWGFFTNLALFLILVGSRLTGQKSDYMKRVAYYLSLVIVIASLVMGGLSFNLGKLCLFCSCAYVLSFLTLFFTYKTTSSHLKYVKEDFLLLFKAGDEGARSYLIFFALVPAFVILSDIYAAHSFIPNMDILIAESMLGWKAEKDQSFVLRSGLFMGDPAHPRMTIVEFADFNCPHCKHAAPSLHAFAASRKDVLLVFQNFPLDGSCNPAINGPGHSCEFAKSTFCAEKESKGWLAHDWLFSHQGQNIEPGLSDMTKELGLDPTRFHACLESSEAHSAILEQAKLGENAGIKGTPSIFVNGKLLPGGHLIPVLEKAYQESNP